MNERVKFLKNFDIESESQGDIVTFGALVFCLNPEEVCEAFDLSFEDLPKKRQAIVRKIQNDLFDEMRDCHRSLLNVLEKGIETLPGPKKTSAANALLYLARALPSRKEHKVLKRLISSKNGNIRAQVYRRLKELPEKVCPDYLKDAWCVYRDFEATKLLLNRASIETLSELFDGLEEDLSYSGPLLSRLYLKLHGNSPATMERLERLNPLSHAYVCAKLGVSLPSKVLVQLYTKEMSGLVIWCAGQMGQWDSILEMHQIAEKGS
ncbi:MAG: hypothetical protein CXR30_05370 [Geobacter sp.]|nr:MAG: hypothetical protein CXR30_05370 [Geobacter sp.]